MRRLHQIVDEIVKITTLIETTYPELYKHLDENPITIPTMEHPKLDFEVMKNYLDELKALLAHYQETHTTNP